MSLSSITTSTPLRAQTDPRAKCEGERERERDTERVRMSLSTKRGLAQGSRDPEKAGCVCFVSVSICSSESAGVDNAHHHNVSDGGDDGDPEPDGIAGHGL